MNSIKIALSQLNFRVGDINGNAKIIIKNIISARDKKSADIIVFPELSLTGYPPEDLVYRDIFHQQINSALRKICAQSGPINIIVGYPLKSGNELFNACSLIKDGELQATYYKQILPNYSVFDEKRYFNAGQKTCTFNINNINVALSICEDIWQPSPSKVARESGATLMLNINASPYHINKYQTREKILRQRVMETGLNIVYVNMVGGQDELIFDGGSMAINESGKIDFKAPHFTEGLFTIDFNQTDKGSFFSTDNTSQDKQDDEFNDIYNALTLGVKDYVKKNGFNGAVIGLSGGIDSALTTCIAVDALGKENVETLIMPSKFTAEISITDAVEQSETLGIKHYIVSIEEIVRVFNENLAPLFTGLSQDTTEENIQARCRGTLLMAQSNKSGKLVLATGNKSEMSVGYATLYGDMAGGFAPLKDVSKTLVYKLANWINRKKEIIPQRVIDRPPSAELKEDQKDEDTLPSYDILDPILEMYIEKNMDVNSIIESGYKKEIVYAITAMVDRNEYKRRQAAPGIRITERAFGRDRRYPITSGYKEY